MTSSCTLGQIMTSIMSSRNTNPISKPASKNWTQWRKLMSWFRNIPVSTRNGSQISKYLSGCLLFIFPRTPLRSSFRTKSMDMLSSISMLRTFKISWESILTTKIHKSLRYLHKSRNLKFSGIKYWKSWRCSMNIRKYSVNLGYQPSKTIAEIKVVRRALARWACVQDCKTK